VGSPGSVKEEAGADAATAAAVAAFHRAAQVCRWYRPPSLHLPPSFPCGCVLPSASSHSPLPCLPSSLSSLTSTSIPGHCRHRRHCRYCPSALLSLARLPASCACLPAFVTSASRGRRRSSPRTHGTWPRCPPPWSTPGAKASTGYVSATLVRPRRRGCFFCTVMAPSLLPDDLHTPCLSLPRDQGAVAEGGYGDIYEGHATLFTAPPPSQYRATRRSSSSSTGSGGARVPFYAQRLTVPLCPSADGTTGIPSRNSSSAGAGRARFAVQREAEGLARLAHPHVARLLAYTSGRWVG
jgi:hypothetical protein